MIGSILFAVGFSVVGFYLTIPVIFVGGFIARTYLISKKKEGAELRNGIYLVMLCTYAAWVLMLAAGIRGGGLKFH